MNNIICFLLLIFMPLLANADPQNSIITQGKSVISQAEFDARIDKISPDSRLSFLSDGQRVEKILRALMRSRRIADVARESGFDQQSIIQLRLKLAIDKELADAWLDKVEREQYDKADFTAMAKEYYLTHPKEFMTTNSVDVAHILISTENRTDSQAEQLASELYEKLQANSGLWDQLVIEYSEDPGSKGNQGKYLGVIPGKMVKPFEDVAFSLTTSGEIAPPVTSSFGVHIIRLDKKHLPKKRSFEEVEIQLTKRQQAYYTRSARTDYISAINTSEPLVIPDCAIEEMMNRYFKTAGTEESLTECRLKLSQ